LLQFSLINAVFILDILQSNLRLLLQLSELVEVLEDKMLAPLFINLNLDLMLLVQVLEFSLLVSEFSLFVFELLLADEPEIVDS